MVVNGGQEPQLGRFNVEVQLPTYTQAFFHPWVSQLVSSQSCKDLHLSDSSAATKEATEVSSDPEARFFSFNTDLNSIFIMEKKGLPNHLAGLPFVDTPSTLGSIITNLEDAGEVGSISAAK